MPGVHGDGENIEVGVYVFVQNVSAHTVHLSSLSVLYPYTETRFRDRLSHLIRYRRFSTNIGWVHTSLSNYDTEDCFPVSIEARKSIDVFIPDETLQDMMADAVRREIRAKVQDALWRDTYSAKMKINLPIYEKERTEGGDGA